MPSSEELHVPHVHHLIGSLKVSIAGTIKANCVADLPFDLPNSEKTREIDDGDKDDGFESEFLYYLRCIHYLGPFLR